MAFKDSEISEVYHAEVNQHSDLESAATEDNSAFVTETQPFPTEQHHWLPQQYREEFESLDIDNNDFVSDLDRDGHQGTLHPSYEEAEHGRNPEWNAFFEQNPDPTREQVIEHVFDVQEAQGYAHYDTHMYNHPNETTEMSSLLETTEPDQANDSAMNDGIFEFDESAEAEGAGTYWNGEASYSSYFENDTDSSVWEADTTDVAEWTETTAVPWEPNPEFEMEWNSESDSDGGAMESGTDMDATSDASADGDGGGSD